MNKNRTSPDYFKILIVMYFIISLVAMGIFFFGSLTEDFESVAMWFTMLAVIMAVAVLVCSVVRAKK